MFLIVFIALSICFVGISHQIIMTHYGHIPMRPLQLSIAVNIGLFFLLVTNVMCLSIEWRIVEDHFKSLCSVLSHNYQLTIDKLKTIPRLLKDGGEQLSKLISSSSPDVRRINDRIITYLIVKLCYNDSNNSLVRLCDVIDELIDSTDTTNGIQQTRCGEYRLCK